MAHQLGGLAAETDVAGTGEMDWARTSGMSPMSPLVGGGAGDHLGLGPFDVDRGRIVTTPLGNAGGVAADGSMATPDGAPGVELLDSWRDLFNLKGSPMPWLLLAALLVLGLMQFRVQARTRIGPAAVDASLG